MTKKTVGQVAVAELMKTPDTRDPIELQREMTKDYILNMEWAIKHMQKKVSCEDLVGTGRGHEECYAKEAYFGDMYVVVHTRKEKVLENVLRNYFFCTLSCPTPTYDQSVYKYTHADENLVYLWTVPSKDTCEMFRDNAALIVPEERDLLGMVLDFYDGTLLRRARALNGENVETGIVLERN